MTDDKVESFADAAKQQTPLHPVYTVTDIQKKWKKIDAIVLQWIYSTLSYEYLLRVLESDSTALQAWNRLKAIFYNNKGPRCTALQTKFVNLKLSACASLEAYCQTLRDLAAQLDDVGSPVNEQLLVLQLV
ncbi:uncharacterized protein LOC110906628 [Helianthus annuus]|uniref:uncharacterized protein LOC110906628 n=1 Tax=Helianthus annuus TaxID=4232 RepID=UPI000B8FCEBD|nr:uncharacterized protein LOC110906628 [Helianthus annuus]